MEAKNLTFEMEEPQLRKRRGVREEIFRFHAHIEEIPFIIGSVVVERVLSDVMGYNLKDPKLWDKRKGMPIPYVYSQVVHEDFRRQGVSPRVILFANEFFKNEYQIPVHSSTSMAPEAEHVWKSLEKRGFSYRSDVRNRARWIMH